MWQFYDKNGALKESIAITPQVLAYAEGSGISLGTSLSDVIVAPSITFDGNTEIYVEYWSNAMQYTTGVVVGDSGALYLYQDSTDLGLHWNHQATVPATTTVSYIPIYIRSKKFTPSAGAHVFKIRGIKTGSGSINVLSNVPPWIRVCRSDWAVYVPTRPPVFTISPMSGGPPTNPTDGDIWIATNVDAIGTRWQFQFDSAEATVYKWKFIGGPRVIARTVGGTFMASNTNYQNPSGVSITVARAGDYIAQISGRIHEANGSAPDFGMGLAAGAVNPTYTSTVSVPVNKYELIAREEILSSVGAGVAIQPRYALSAAVPNQSIDFEVLSVQPIRIS